MSEIMNIFVTGVNGLGRAFCGQAAGMALQAGVLIAVLICVDVLLRKRVRATLRYWIWMLVFVKLLLPPGLAIPTGIGYWLGPHAPPRALQIMETAREPVYTEPTPPAEIPPLQPSVPASVAIKSIVPAERVATPSEGLAWQGGVLLLWGVGVVVFAGLVMQRLFFVRGLTAQATPAQGHLVDVLDECRSRMGIRRKVGLRLSPKTFSPAVCGLLNPTILMPAELVERLSPENLRAVLIHELAHIKRGDLWINSLQTALQIVYFYNPLVWLANAIVRRVREQAVDEMVLVALGAEARSYSTTLIDIAEMAFLRVSPALRLVGVAESRKSLEGRIRHMMTRPIPKSARVGVIGVLVVTVIGAILLPMATAQTEPTKPQVTATLPNGVTVELVGVCHWPGGQPICWRPDGSTLDRPLRVTKVNARPRANDYGLMLRVTGPDDLELSWNTIEGADSWEGSCDVVDARGSRLDDYTAATALVKDGLTQTALRVGIATGPWSTVSSHDGGGMNYGGHDTILWSQGFEDARGISIVATSEWKKDRVERIVAIDKEGKVHVSPGGSVAAGNMDQRTTRFNGLRGVQIKEFQYQVRPYEWVEFKNISLQPGRGTDTHVEWGGLGRGGDVAIESFRLSPGSTEGTYRPVVSIRNRGEVASPEIAVRFHTGDPAIDGPIHGAGPLSPGEVWNETTSAEFVLADGVHTMQVVLDPDNLVEELDETNNRAELRIVVKDGQIVEQSAVPAGAEESEISQSSSDAAARRASAQRLGHLIRAALIYSNEHDDRLPDSMADLRDELDPADKEWLSQNVAYLGKGVSLWTEDPGRVVAYDKTLLAQGDGTNVLYLDTHVKFEKPQKLERLGITPNDAAVIRRNNEADVFRGYEVNRSVADFPAGEDFSTPEAAYAAINRMDQGDPAAWLRVDVARLADRMRRGGSERKRTIDPEWAKVMQNARIQEVLVWNMTRATVIAELPQELSSKKIVEPFDRRSFELENGRWLNTGNSRFNSIEEAKTQFMGWMKRETAQADAMRDPLAHADEIKAAAAKLFEKLRTADYTEILSYYHDGKWDADGWKKFPTLGLYTVQTDYPSFALWCCMHFKDNPIVDVQLGDVFISDALVADKTGRPTVPYRLTLKDGSTLAGNLPFEYEMYRGQGCWNALIGIDWHLWPSGAKREGVHGTPYTRPASVP